ncbi:MAG: hypothetical protein QXQ29_05705 [Candidatus Bathyarchaeia archaeon]
MSNLKSIPDYRGALSLEKSRRVVKALASKSGVANFSELERLSSVKGSVLKYHLDRLIRFNIIEEEVRGTYRLRFKTPLCWIYDSLVDYAYLGLLGRRAGRREPEPATALRLLEEQDIKPRLVYVVTSIDALKEWVDLKLTYQWILCYNDEILDIDAIIGKVRPQLEALLREYIVVMDCTSLTKPATIAYYDLAATYYVPLIYIYEDAEQLKWLISKDKLKNMLNLT